VVLFFFLKSKFIDVDDNCYCSSSETYICCISKYKYDTSNLRESFLIPSAVRDSIFNLKGGSNEFIQENEFIKSEEQKLKLIKSILAKAPDTSYQQISINKFLTKVYNLLEPLIFNWDFWKVIHEFQKGVDPKTLPMVKTNTFNVKSSDVIGPIQTRKSNTNSPLGVEAFGGSRIQRQIYQK